MDTLPIRFDSISQMKPGDLIFYEGNYNNIVKRSKPQKHNNVHVEIFLGSGPDGEGTIGSRFFRSKVALYDSYKFVSTTWECTKHHFVSIDTWLDGLCVSHCAEHKWDMDEVSN